MNNEIKSLQQLVHDFVKVRDWTKYHSPKNLAMSIAIEAAELMELFQWLSTEEAENPITIKQLRQEIEDEVADVFIYLLSFSNICNIDINTVIRRKMNRNETRFSIEKIKGKLP